MEKKPSNPKKRLLPKDDLLRFLLTPGKDASPSPDTSSPTRVTPPGPIGDFTSIPPPPERDERSGGDPVLEQIQLIFAELVARKMEGLALYKPQETQEKFHASNARHRLALGSNRSGKTLSAAIELARACTGQDPHKKYPQRDGVAFVIGKNWDHNGDVLYRKLCRAGAFKIIRDQWTKQWRTFKPNDPFDWERRNEAKPAPPLIPPRMIQSIAWLNKKKSQPSTIKMRNGWELRFFSSEGKPPQGAALHICWFDEEIIDPDWLPEMRARLLDHNGVLIWSATPQAGTEQLYGLYERSLEEANEPSPSVSTFEMLLAANQYMHEKAKLDFERDIDDDDQRQVRIEGKFILTSYKVFPEWRGRHFVEWFQIPPHWTRYVFIDPGRQVAAALFVAVPPPNESPHVYAYDEVYCRDADARKFADMVRAKFGTDRIQCMWIDMHEARKRDAGTGARLYDVYSRAFRKRRIVSEDSGYGFRRAPDDPDGGREAMREWLTEDEDGITRLRVFRDRCPNLDKEMKVYRYRRVKKDGGWVITDEPVKKRDHLVDCLRYAASIDPVYVQPRKGQSRKNNEVRRALRARQKLFGSRSGKRRRGINLGPGK
jgi:hypothetical protein